MLRFSRINSEQITECRINLLLSLLYRQFITFTRCRVIRCHCNSRKWLTLTVSLGPVRLSTLDGYLLKLLDYFLKVGTALHWSK